MAVRQPDAGDDVRIFAVQAMTYPPSHQWIADKLGTKHWKVGRHVSLDDQARGYVGIDRNRYRNLLREWQLGHPAVQAVSELPDTFPNKNWLVDAAIAHLPFVDDFKPKGDRK